LKNKKEINKKISKIRKFLNPRIMKKKRSQKTQKQILTTPHGISSL
jgi:hypothetical protein